MCPVPAFKTFLSHRYKSSDVNEYFFEIFSDRAEVVFDVDEAAGATNVTRLERMIRSSHGFVAIYPFAPDPKLADAPIRQQRRHASQYFRLEMGLAARARKPVLVYADRRFGSDFELPPSAFFAEFDHDEVTGGGGSPNRDIFRDVFGRFVDQVRAGMAYEATYKPTWRTERVGVLLQTDPPYDAAIRDRLRGCISEIVGEPQAISWPGTIDSRFIAAIHEYDWIVTDIGLCQETGLLGFLEGRFLPLLRLRHLPPDADRSQRSLTETTLYGAYEVGYSKDIVRWSGGDELERELRARLSRIQQEPRHIVKRDDARMYFRSAALRKEPVFISYSGADVDRARPIIDAFRNRFQHVFDYKDGESIAAGRPWLDEIFTSLQRSSLAVLLLSPSYFASGHCEHEAKDAVAERDSRKLQVLPVRLTEIADIPPWLKELQHLRLADGAPPSLVVDRGIALLGDAL